MKCNSCFWNASRYMFSEKILNIIYNFKRDDFTCFTNIICPKCGKVIKIEMNKIINKKVIK